MTGIGPDSPTGSSPGEDVDGRLVEIRIDRQGLATERTPLQRLHGQRVIEYVDTLLAVEVNPDRCAGPRPRTRGGNRQPPVQDHEPGTSVNDEVVTTADGRAIRAVVAARDGHRARLLLWPPMPDPTTMADGEGAAGRWGLQVDEARLVSGPWSACRTGSRVHRPAAAPAVAPKVATTAAWVSRMTALAASATGVASASSSARRRAGGVTSEIDPLTCTETSEHRLDDGSMVLLREHHHLPNGLRTLAASVGFEVEAVWAGGAGDWRREPPSVGDHELLLLARRPG